MKLTFHVDTTQVEQQHGIRGADYILRIVMLAVARIDYCLGIDYIQVINYL